MIMNKARKQLAWAVISAALAVFSAGAPVLADDIEIFVAGEDPDADGGVLPNIMFIIDTSGSMATEVQTQANYDKDTRYEIGACDVDTIYITTTTNPPNCSASNPRRFQRSLNNCFEAETMFDSGQLYEGQLLYWRANRNKWRKLRNSGNITSIVDCEDDQRDNNGRTPDGEALNDDKYARNGNNGPYSAQKLNQPNFSNSYYLWSGNVLNWANGVTQAKTRLETVQDVVINLLNTLQDVKVGLMRFNSYAGGPVLIDIKDIAVNDAQMNIAVSNLTDGGWTPLAETFYEFGRYMYGDSVLYGDGYEYDSVADSRTGNDINSTQYESPVEFLCQKNYVVYLTDGEPTKDTGSVSNIENMIGKSCANDHNNSNGKCLDELAEYYANTPVLTNGEPINTYTIGFNIDLPLLADTASKGGGKYFRADDTAELSETLTKIVVEILKDSTTFTAPAVPVNSFNRTETLNTVYTSLFQPSSSVHWPGNLKRYAFTGGEFVGQDGETAVNPESGFFKSTAWSFWSTLPDGDDVVVGGAAEQLPEYGARNIYTDLNSGNIAVAENKIAIDNTNLTAGIFGEPSGTTDINGSPVSWREVLINWLNGEDYQDSNDNQDPNGAIINDTRRQMGDPLHVRPTPVAYGLSENNPDIVVYITTNDGYLHAIDADTGAELWSYIPGSLLDRMLEMYSDEVTAIKTYMLDGQPIIYVLNDDGLPGFTGAGERGIMVFGMRRGGSSYFALDITDKNNPVKLWEINDDPTGDFPGIGQTWSLPKMGLIKIGSGSKTAVAIFGGGYDDTQDTDAYSTDTEGNAVYMVDLLTGEKVWSAGNNSTEHDLVLDMQHSIPAPPLVIDTNRDGLLDRLYVGDTGGRLWRMDFFNGNALSTFASGGILATLGGADLGSTPAAADLRRFYNQVDLVEDELGETRYFALNIGSGYRAHPLDRVIDEEFYSIRDFKPYTPITSDDPTYDNPVVRSQLIDITSKPVTPVSANSPGWRLSMNLVSGEKVLGKSLTINGVVYFSSFAPGGAADSCTAGKGSNRLYAINLSWGRPVINGDVIAESEDYDDFSDYATDLKFGGIASPVYLMTETVTIANPDGSTKEQSETFACSGLGCPLNVESPPPKRTFWTEEGL
jgi:type IV pilus assembly protein PilY1